jgi:hypothetical protein
MENTQMHGDDEYGSAPRQTGITSSESHNNDSSSSSSSKVPQYEAGQDNAHTQLVFNDKEKVLDIGMHCSICLK